MEKMDLSEQGKMANQYWLEIPHHFSFVFLDEFVVMPNHLHGIIIIDKPGNNNIDNVTGDDFDVINISDISDVETGMPYLYNNNLTNLNHQNHPHNRFRNQGKNTISAMVGSFKSAVTKWCNENNLPFGWQSRFHDHIIWDNDEFHRIKNYIINNPVNWEQDKFFKTDS